MDGPTLMVQECRRHIPSIFVRERKDGADPRCIPFNSIQPTWTRPQSPELRRQRGPGPGQGPVRGRGRAAAASAVAVAVAFPPSLDSLQTWPPPPPNPFPSLQIWPPIFISSPSQIARSLALYIPQEEETDSPAAAGQTHPLPCLHRSLPGARKQAGTGCRPRGSAVNPPWQPPHNSNSSFSGHPQPGDQPGQSRAGQTNHNTSSSSYFDRI